MMFFALTAMSLALSAPAPAAAPIPAPEPMPAVITQAPRATRYCVIDVVTGSRIPERVCLTRDAWIARGFDPLAAK